jgi:hypothetical protein
MTVRLAAWGRSLLALLLLAGTGGSTLARAVDDGVHPPSAFGAGGGLLVGEVMTSGATSSDEFVELYNAAPETLDLMGLELVYVTSSGLTVTRKADWSASVPVEPGRHVLIANTSGTYAGSADATYSGGISATGGTMALRFVGGEVIDSLSWGDAASALVEGTAGAAPPSGSSLERRPGGAMGNGTDTGDNSVDAAVQPEPVPQALADPPSPSPVDPTPGPTETVQPTAPPSGTPMPIPSVTVPPTPTASPTARPTATASPTARPTTTPTPTPAATPRPTPTATPRPTATASPQRPMPIAEARELPVDSFVFVRGTVTVQPGRIVDDRVAAIQDGSGGIAIRIASTDTISLTPGERVDVVGRLADPYGNLEVRPAVGGILPFGQEAIPDPAPLRSDEVDESTEGRLAQITGEVEAIEAGSAASFAMTLADARGLVRVFVFGSTGATREPYETGQRLRVTGIVGQRESSRGAGDGHRLWPRSSVDLDVRSEPEPTPRPSPTRTATPRPTATARPTPTPRPTATARPTSSATSRPAAMTIAEALRRGGMVSVEGVVTAPAGLLDADRRRVTIQDRSGAVLLRVPDGTAAPGVGTRVRVAGTVGTYYGAPQLEADGAPVALGRAPVQPRTMRRPPAAGEEWLLVRVAGTVTDVARSGTAWRAELTLAGDGALPISGVSGSGIDSTALTEGGTATVTGIVRRAYPTASDQRFAVVPRGVEDVRGSGGPADSGGPSGAPGGATGAAGSTLAPAAGFGGPGGASPSPGSGSYPPGPVGEGTTIVLLKDLPLHEGRVVRVGGRVTAVTSEQVSIDDGTAAASLRVASGAFSIDLAPPVGDVINATGTVEGADDGPWVVVLESLADIVAPGTVVAPSLTPGLAGPSITAAAAGAAIEQPRPGQAVPVPLIAAGLIGVGATGIATTLAVLRWRQRQRRPTDEAPADGSPDGSPGPDEQLTEVAEEAAVPAGDGATASANEAPKVAGEPDGRVSHA